MIAYRERLRIRESEGGKNYRGSSDIQAAVDAAFLLESDGGEGTEPMQSLKLSCFKMRAAGEPRPIHLKLGESCFEVTADPSADRERERLEKLADAIGQSTAGLSARDVDGLAKTLAMSRAEVRASLKRLEDDRRVTNEKGRYRLGGSVRIDL